MISSSLPSSSKIKRPSRSTLKSSKNSSIRTHKNLKAKSHPPQGTVPTHLPRDQRLHGLSPRGSAKPRPEQSQKGEVRGQGEGGFRVRRLRQRRLISVNTIIILSTIKNSPTPPQGYAPPLPASSPSPRGCSITTPSLSSAANSMVSSGPRRLTLSPPWPLNSRSSEPCF